MSKCVFAGTFDPITIGHKAVVDRSLKIFDEVVVALLINYDKQVMLDGETRLRLLKKTFAGYKNVRITAYEGAVADLLRAENTCNYVRGVRGARDFEYETADFYASQDLYPEINVVYLPADRNSTYVSSTLVRKCVLFGKDFAKYVPTEIYDDLLELANKKG